MNTIDEVKALLEAYLDDYRENLLLLNDCLIKLQSEDADYDVINSLFRVAHTLKGSSAGIEFFNIEKVMHSIEDILQDVRDKKIIFNQEILKLLFQCYDFLEDALVEIEENNSDKNIDISAMMSSIEKFNEIRKNSFVKENDRKNKNQNQLFENSNKNDKTELKNELYEIPIDDIDLLNAMIENCKRGHTAYKLNVYLDKEVQMKSLSIWMIFRAIDRHALYIYSVPEKSENENAVYEIEGSLIEIFVLAENSLEDLEREIELVPNFIGIEKIMIEPKVIQKKKNILEDRKKIKKMLNEVEVGLLDLEKREINKRTLMNIENSLKSITKVAETVMGKDFMQIINELTLFVKTLKNSDVEVVCNYIEGIALIINKLENILEENDSKKVENSKKELEEAFLNLQKNCIVEKKKIGELLSENNIINASDVEEILNKQKQEYKDLKFGQVAVKENKASAYEILNVMKEQKAEKTQKSDATKENAFIKIPIAKVDGLMDMLGELLILNGQLEQKVMQAGNKDTSLSNIMGKSTRIIKDIQTLYMNLRMVEIKPLLHRLTRIIRDTASELSKKVSIEIEGEETEIDKSVSEKLFDPLMHLVRNAVSHGIETEEERVKSGKKPEGKIIIRVYSKRGNVYIEVEDDGRGIDIDKVYEKAKLKGLVIEGKNYSRDEIISFIFNPGFSTQEEINKISGRGVGLDVVQSEITKLGGKVEIETNQGSGSKFIVKIPLNLAVVNGTIIEVAGGRYILPTLFIKEFIISKNTDWVSIKGKNKAIKVRENIIPVINANDIFNYSSTNNANELSQKIIVILEMDQKYIAFPVDRIVARQEIVSKPVEKEISCVGYAAGMTILGDGKVSVILDVEAMFKKVG